MLAVPGDPMLFGRRQLPECRRVAVRLEHGVVAEALAAARRPDQYATDAALEGFRMAVRPRQHERGHEMGAPISRRGRAALSKLALDALHGGLEVLGRPAPTS